MVRLVHVNKGQWAKSQQGVWRFEEDRNIARQDILIRENEPIDRLRGFIRGVFNLTMETPLLITFELPTWMLEPDSETCPPHNIVSTADVEMLMSVHGWNMEPTLCVIFGAEDVAKYQFICRAPFQIGSRTFLGEGITEEAHMAAINDMVRGQEMLFSADVLHELFSEEKMVAVYRFSLEIEKARNRLDLNVGAGDDYGDHVVPLRTGTNSLEPRLGSGNQVERPERFGHNNGSDMYGLPSGAWMMNRNPTSLHGGMGGSFVQNEHPHLYQANRRAEQTWTRYWENFMSSSYALELQRMYGVMGSENVGYPQTALNIGSPNTPFGPPITFVSDESSTASSAGAKPRGECNGERSISNVGRADPLTGGFSVKGESSAMGAQQGNQANTTELFSTLNYEVGGPSIQQTPGGGNDVAAEDGTSVKDEEGSGGMGNPR